jgi:RNA polymerase sigma-70 factor (ECF subfamily)
MTLDTLVVNDWKFMPAGQDSSLEDRTFRREEAIPAGRTDDRNLALRIRSGDQSAFRELVERHQSRIFRVLYRILHHTADAEDIAQDAFAKVYFSIHQFDHRSSLLTWIYRIAVNEAYSHLRKRRVRRFSEGDPSADAGGADLHSLIDGRPTPDQAAAQRDLLNKLLALIPEDDRLLLLWREVEGYSIARLAEMTGMNENTVKVRLFRIRRKLVEMAARFSRGPLQASLSSRPLGLEQDRL